MSRTRFKEVRRMIRSTLFFFITLSVVTAVTVVTYTGISFVGISLEDSCERYFDDHNFYDLQVTTSTGFTEQKLDILSGSTRVDKAEPAYSYQELIRIGENNYVAELFTQSGDINRMKLVSGRLPEKPDECTVEQALLDRFSLSVGDKIVLPAKSDRMAYDCFTIVGSVDLVTVFVTDDFYNRGVSDIGDGQVATKIAVLPGAFTEETPMNTCFLTLRNKEARTDKNYEATIKAAKSEIIPLLERYEEVEYEKVKREAERKVRDGKTELERATRSYDRIEKSIGTKKEDMDAARKKFAEAQENFNNEKYTERYRARQFVQAQVGLADREQAFSDAYYGALEEMDNATRAQQEIDEYSALLETLSAPEITVTDVFANPSYNSYRMLLRGIDTVVGTLCLLLVAISMLVCFTTISRMITEDHRIIGAQKAMGFTSGEICMKYIVYSVLCSFLGGAGGVAISYYYMEQIVYTIVYGEAFIFREFVPIIDWRYAIGIVALNTLCMCLSAVIACRQMLSKSAIALLNSEIREAYSGGVKKSRLPITLRMTLRNLRGNPKILLTTFVSVAGCTALMISALTVRYAVGGIADRQFDELQHYQGILAVDSAASGEDKAALSEFVENSTLVKALPVLERFVGYRNGEKINYATLICVESDSDYEDFLVLEDAETGKTVSAPKNGVLVCKKIAELYGFTAGNSITLTDGAGREAPARIAGVFERNIGMAIVTTDAFYEELLHEKPEANQYYIRGDAEAMEEFSAEAKKLPAYCSFTESGYYRAEMEYKVNAINSAVIVIFVLTLLLTLFVLFTSLRVKACCRLIKNKIFGFYCEYACYRNAAFLSA